jgi:hypothetical protein
VSVVKATKDHPMRDFIGLSFFGFGVVAAVGFFEVGER